MRLRPALRLIRDLAREWREDRVAGLAAEVAFWAILGLFPLLLALAAALGFLNAIIGADVAARAEATVVDFLRRILTEDGDEVVASVQELFREGNAGLLTFGLVAALWAVMRTFAAVIRALDVVYDLEERRTWVSTRLTAAALSLGSLVTAAVLLAVFVVGPLLGRGHDIADLVGLGGAFALFWDWVRFPVAAAVLVAWAATVYHIAPNHTTPWRNDVPGAVMAAVLWGVMTVGFRLYLGVAGRTNEVLGALGGALAVLLWLYLLGLALMLGGELNAIHLKNKAKQ